VGAADVGRSTGGGVMSTIDRTETIEIEQFLYHEAWLLEQRHYQDWLALMTDDIVYFLPNRREEGDAVDDAMIARDGMPQLKKRVDRMNDPLNPALQPPPRTKYFVTNVTIVERGPEVRVRSSVLLYIVRDRTVRHHPISCEYRLRPELSTWRIAYKRVYLLENAQALRTLPII
jgi:3-phenylpropionate/cinnamic acid dioxygenase small subunit